jgi:hypothetical protein
MAADSTDAKTLRAAIRKMAEFDLSAPKIPNLKANREMRNQIILRGSQGVQFATNADVRESIETWARQRAERFGVDCEVIQYATGTVVFTARAPKPKNAEVPE